MHFEASPGANMGGSKHLFDDVSVYTGYILTKTLQTLKKKTPSHLAFRLAPHQELPSVRLLEGDVHWTNDNSLSLEPTEIAAVMTTRACGPGNQVTRQCVKAGKNYRTLGLFLTNNITPPKFNMEPENDGFQKGITFSRDFFSGSMLNFRGVYVSQIVWGGVPTSFFEEKERFVCFNRSLCFSLMVSSTFCCGTWPLHHFVGILDIHKQIEDPASSMFHQELFCNCGCFSWRH